MKEEKERFYVELRVKPYVKRYLLTRYGVRDRRYPGLVNIGEDKELKSFVLRALRKPCYREDKRISTQSIIKRPDTVKVEISHDSFSRYGFEISKTDNQHFNSIVEHRCKAQMLSFIAAQMMVLDNFTFAVEQFYKAFNFDALVWPAASIRKVWERDSTIDKIELKGTLLKQIQSIFKAQMSVIPTNAQ